MDLTRWTSKDVDKIFDAANRYSVGLDDIFYRLHSYGSNHPGGQYPPYNIVKESNVKWRIEIALAGWAPEDVEVTTESNVLLVKSVASKNDGEEEYMHRGLSSRTFARGFNLSDDVEVGTVSFNNGLLVVELRKIIPEHQKRKVYEIQNSQLPESDSVPSSDTL
ncbi:heat shock protein [Synechococcus phage S-CAM8]|uniref:Heat shock protein n=1 Tax=Synechococcus phage S-CAM8 TaxID=754038 RepID=R9TR50_9CAUD|nr:Hsp20 heat shock protein [Synechococcus phage S-CAM8]AGN33984.1 heat shock protein [Synechococcus phage S-CAM8]